MDFGAHTIRRAALGATAAAGVAFVAFAAWELINDQNHPPADAGSKHQPGLSARRILFGAWEPGGTEKFQDLEQRVGRRFDIEHWYQGWGVPDPWFDLRRARDVAARGAIPMVTWEPWDYLAGRVQPRYALRSIAEGNFDSYIRQNAGAMKRVDGRVWLRFGHEMNNDAYPWSIGVNGNTARHYIQAWHRIVRIYRNQGAHNVRFVWAVNTPGPGDTPLHRAFPGDAYTSYVGMDGYNRGGSDWMSSELVFGEVYRQLRGLSKRPVIITETGSSPMGGSKPDWILDFGRNLRRNFPAVRAVVWFNENREADWRLDSDSASLAAARTTFRREPFV